MDALVWILVLSAAALAVAHRLTQLRVLIGGWTGRIVLGIWLLPIAVVALWWFDMPLPTPVAVLCLGLTGILVWRRRMAGAAAVNRLGERARRKSGVASALDVWRFGSALALRGKAGVIRPSLAELAWHELLRVPATEFAARIGRVGWLRHIWVSLEMVTLIVAGPRMGKSGSLATRIVDAPGPVIATSTRTDLFDLTAAARIAKGFTVYVFNAVGLGNLKTTLPFDPLVGCEDPTAAFERASDMAGSRSGGAQASGDREYWDGQARRILAALLHAAALGRKRGTNVDMADVAAWVADTEAHKATIVSYLRQSPQPVLATVIEGFISTNERTRTSITSAMAPATAWLTSPAACAAAQTGATIDVERLIAEGATIYLIGAQETQSEALVAALVGYITREARRLAGLSPSGRLDPILSMVLDEAGLLAPPLHEWTADMGGRGICIVAAFQSRQQMLDCWNPVQAGVTLNNTATVVLMGGTKDPEDLATWAKLIGDRDEVVTSKDAMGKVTSSTVRQVPVFSPTQISNLRGATKRRPAQAIVIHTGMPPALTKIAMLWQRGLAPWYLRVPAWLELDRRALVWLVGLRNRRGLAGVQQIPVPAATPAPAQQKAA